MSEPLPIIRFICSCGEQVYAVSTNVLGIFGERVCKSCARVYVLTGSIIGQDASQPLRQLYPYCVQDFYTAEPAIQSRLAALSDKFC